MFSHSNPDTHFASLSMRPGQRLSGARRSMLIAERDGWIAK
jgi:hypothetical protein